MVEGKGREGRGRKVNNGMTALHTYSRWVVGLSEDYFLASTKESPGRASTESKKIPL